MAAVALAVFFALLLVDGRRRGNVFTGDTESLVYGARVALECAKDGILRACERLPDSVFSNVFPYPMLQYLPSIAMVALGMDDPSVVRGLAVVNVVAFFGSLGCVIALGRRALVGWTPILLALLLGSPLLFYSISGFGEMLAAFMALLFITMTLLRRPWLAGVTLMFACLGKETMAPFLVGLGLLCTWASDAPPPARRRMATAVAAGGAAGLAVTFGFNFFRFGVPVNTFYLDPIYRVPGVGRAIDFFGALWVAPGGGLLWFWTPVAALLVLAVVVAARQRAARGDPRSWLPLAGVVALFASFQAALSLWPFPYGWIAWGPRLTVPLVPAVLVAVAHTGGAPLKAALDRCTRSGVALAAVAVLLVATSLPHSGAVWNYQPATLALLEPADRCASLRSLPPPPDPEFYRCQHEVMWRWRPSFLLRPVRSERRPAQAGQLALGAGLAALTLLWRGDARRQATSSTRTSSAR